MGHAGSVQTSHGHGRGERTDESWVMKDTRARSAKREGTKKIKIWREIASAPCMVAPARCPQTRCAVNHIHTYTFTHTHHHIHTYTFTHTHHHIHTYTFTHTHITTYTHTHSHIHISPHTHIHIHTYTYHMRQPHTHAWEHKHTGAPGCRWSRRQLTPPALC